MKRPRQMFVAGGDVGGRVVLLACLVFALGLHAALLPVVSGALGGAPEVAGGGPRLEWAPSVAAGVAGDALPLELLIDGADALPQGVEVQVRWSRQDNWGGAGDGEEREVARWDRWSAPGAGMGAGADTARLGWAWRVPRGLSGPGWLLARARRAGAAADDPSGWSPVAARTLWVEPERPPEVGVNQIVAPDAVAAGGVLRVGYTLVNRGPGWAHGRVEDRVELRPVDAPRAQPWTVSTGRRREPMAPGDTRRRDPAAVRLPADTAPGRYELVVTPGGPGAVVGRRVIEVRPATHPDLAVAEFEAPPTVTAGQAFPLRFVVDNRAPRATGPGLWGDRVYLSADDVLGPGDVMLKSEPRVMPLEGFGAYASPEHAVTVAAEHAVSSVMFLIVSVDDEDHLDEGAFEGNNTRARPVTVVRPEDADADIPELKLGQDDAPAERVTVAWIAYDDFQELQARRSVTHQPAVQARVEPTPDAPLRSDASPDRAGPSRPGVVDDPSPAAPAQPRALPAAEPADLAEPTLTDERAPERASGAVPEPAPEIAPEPAADVPTTLDPDAVVVGAEIPAVKADAPPEPPPVDAAADSMPPTPLANAVADAATTPVPTPEPRPSSTPQSDREADPTAPIGVSVVRPGRVLVGPGLEVRTVRPRFSATARTLSVPSNPEVVVTFEPDGTVRVAELRTSTGFDNIDGPLLSSLYAWTATGPRLAEGPEVRVAITILFREPVAPVRAPDPAPESE